jgi:hypothetical protein
LTSAGHQADLTEKEEINHLRSPGVKLGGKIGLCLEVDTLEFCSCPHLSKQSYGKSDGAGSASSPLRVSSVQLLARYR